MPTANVKALYAATTGDRKSHQRTIDAALRKLTPDQVTRIRMRATGLSYHQIANLLEGPTHASVRESILRGLEAIRKSIAAEPRYNKRGRRNETVGG